MNSKKIVVDAVRTIGIPPYWLCEIKEDWEYSNGTRTGAQLGWKYIIAAPAAALERISVKIPGKKLLELEDGEIAEVTFSGLELGVYVQNGGLALSAKAQGISLAASKKA